MQKIEDFVRENKCDFDVFEPSEEIWNRVETELNKNKNHIGSRFWKIGVAAAVLLVALITTFVLAPSSDDSGIFVKTDNPEIKNLIETEAYYSSQVNGKLAEIRKCYQIFPELENEIESDLSELDAMYNDLLRDLKDNAYNSEVIEAMIQNTRLKLELVDRVLEQINC